MDMHVFFLMVIPILFLIQLILFIIGFYRAIKSNDSIGNKVLWIIFMAVFIIVGPIIFLVQSKRSPAGQC